MERTGISGHRISQLTARKVKEEWGMTLHPEAVDACADAPHEVECEVRRRLMADGDCEIHSLVVHRVPDGVCIEGVVDGGKSLEEITRTVESVTGVRRVLNRLVQRRPALKG